MTAMYLDPLNLITNAICFAGLFLVCHHTMQRRYSLWITILFEALLFFANIILGSVIPYLSVWRILYLPVLWIPSLSMLYGEKWYRVALLFLLLYLAIVIADLIGATFYYSPEMVQEGDLQSGSLLWKISVRVQTVLILYVLYLLVYLIIRRGTTNLTRHQTLLLILYPLSIILFMYFMTRVIVENPNIAPGYTVFTFVTVCGSMVLLFVLSLRSSRQTVIEAENSLLSRQLELQLKHYEGLAAQYEDVRVMRHDITKHMNTVQALLEEGRGEEASANFSEIRSELPERGYGICEHPIVDAFLHYFIGTAEAAGVRVETVVSVPYGISVTPHDLICIFGNLLDNALEGCQDASEPFIRIRSIAADGYFLVSMENSVSMQDAAAPKSRRIPQLQRGVGFTILQQIARKYDGHFSGNQEGAVYHSELSLKVGESTC